MDAKIEAETGKSVFFSSQHASQKNVVKHSAGSARKIKLLGLVSALIKLRLGGRQEREIWKTG
jgi:hypothetical protein